MTAGSDCRLPALVHRCHRLPYIRPDSSALVVSTNRGFCKQVSERLQTLRNTSGPFLPHSRSLTYEQELVIVVCHAEGCLPVDFARGGVHVASLREGGEMGDGVRQPETLSVVKEHDPCRKHANDFFQWFTCVSRQSGLHAGKQFGQSCGFTVMLVCPWSSPLSWYLYFSSWFLMLHPVNVFLIDRQ